MKMEQLIVQYLYSSKKVTLQDIGVFIISTDINIPVDSEKDTVLPENAIEFIYDAKAGVDEGLIQYIVENTRKIRPLATSDLESFIILNKQFLNIGKPLIIEGLGTLQKTQAGIYTFTQANTSHVMLKEPPKVVTEKTIEKISFATPQKENNVNTSKFALFGILGLVLLAALGFAAYYFITKKENNEKNDSNIAIEKNDTSSNISPNKIKPSDTAIITKPIAKAIVDTNSFYVVIKEYPELAVAQKRLNTLRGYGNNLILSTKDSITYKMKMPFKLPLSDTLRIKDSLSKFFKAKTLVELP
jgi:hypothetical protein